MDSACYVAGLSHGSHTTVQDVCPISANLCTGCQPIGRNLALTSWYGKGKTTVRSGKTDVDRVVSNTPKWTLVVTVELRTRVSGFGIGDKIRAIFTV
jgi:hypothetical protein